MASPLSVKRRKLNDGPATLERPFVSPLRTSKTDRTPLKEQTSNIHVRPRPYTPSTLAHTIKQASLASETAGQSSGTVAPNVSRIKATPLRKQPIPWSSKKRTDPEEIAAQKAITSLELQIRKVQNDLDTLKQAQHISNSSTDADLEALTDKWRLASQAVAEELFGSVKERVCRMGGVAAWREMEKRKYDRANGLGEFAREEDPVDDDADCEFDSEGEELPEEEQLYRKKMKHQARQEMMDAAEQPDEPQQDANAEKNKVWQEEGKEDDTFTMDMMLRSMNIDLAVIGYDKTLQRWVT
ncbi:hypothetical protein DOTSEDRAFT_51904 [Lecanosticta acicola]|uniref:Swi5-dependent recombination DNA repair protein 1 n=1 Tax=Lecanosticta acicola TaxID=111012 RepID=A0AAI8W1G3_9PEZI|nr:hypothetical protein DOTSEDRAFT_51904 [Lecanosticta acicola]